MKFAKKLTATIAVCASVTFAGAGVSSAKVFHGHWIGGRIEEAYHRLGGWEGVRCFVCEALIQKEFH
ncbi:hypothetical protein CIP107510_01537 [Corynebacterium diphtheriae]|nr:hypothetical protein CIP107510_01537 [Corynebacterium diphtheriae]CAB1020282.1 hypothetical protein FRC0538_01728 [Corynebacterium diphtheriae]